MGIVRRMYLLPRIYPEQDVIRALCRVNKQLQRECMPMLKPIQAAYTIQRALKLWIQKKVQAILQKNEDMISNEQRHQTHCSICLKVNKSPMYLPMKQTTIPYYAFEQVCFRCYCNVMSVVRKKRRIFSYRRRPCIRYEDVFRDPLYFPVFYDIGDIAYSLKTSQAPPQIR